MSQQRASVGLVAFAVVALLGGGAWLLLRSPEAGPPPIGPTRTIQENPVPKVVETAKPESPSKVKSVDKTAFNPGADIRGTRDQFVIGGFIVTSEGAPIVNATVELYYDASAVITTAQESDLRGTATTADSGGFYFSAESCPGCALSLHERYVLKVSHADYATERVSGIELRDATVENRTIVMYLVPNRVSGQITDRNGAPVAGAEVKVYDLNTRASNPDGAIERSAFSGADGMYVVNNIKPGLKKIWVSKSGFASQGRQNQAIDSKLVEVRANFRLRSGFSIAGAVMSQETGLAIEGAYVTLKPTRLGAAIPAGGVAPESELAEIKRRMAAGDSSDAVKEAIRGGAVREKGDQRERVEPRDQSDSVEAAKKRREEMIRRTKDVGGNDGAGGTDDVDASARAEDDKRRMHELAQDAAAQQTNMQLTQVSFRTTAEGRFKADGLEEGSYQLTVTAPGFAPPPIQAADTGADGVIFNLIANARILGVCVDDETGKPISSFTVGLGTAYDQNSVPYHMRRSFGPPKSKDGSFEYVDIRPGSYFLLAEAPGYAGGRSEQIVVAQAEKREGIVIRLVKGATVLGRVVDGQGKPVVDATVSLEAGASSEAHPFLKIFQGQIRRESKDARTGTDGAFRLPNVLEGRYTVKVRHPEFGPFDDPIVFDVPKSGELSRPDIVLARGAMVRGRVLTKDGAPDDKAMVQVLPNGGNAFAQRQAQTDAEGKYSITGLAPGEYRIFCAQHGGVMDLGALFTVALANSPNAPAGAAPPRTYVLTEGQTLDLDF